MTRVALRGITTRRLRTVLTALAIVLGVAMVSGSYTLTDTMGGAATRCRALHMTTDAVVSAKTAFKADDEFAGSSLGSSLAAEAGARPAGCRAGRRQHQRRGPHRRQGRRCRRHRPVLRRRARPASRRALAVQAEGGPLRHRSGPGRDRRRHGGPRGLLARRHDHNSSPRARAEGRGHGIATFGDVDSIGTATFALFDLQAAQTLFDKHGRYTEILVGGPSSVRKQLSESLGGSLQVQTAAAHDRFTLDGLKTFVKFLKILLLVFGGDRRGGGCVHHLQHAVDHGRAALA